MRDCIAKDRKLESAALNTLCDSVVVTFKADRLLKEKLVDKLVYRNQMEDILRARTKVDKKDDLNYVSPEDLADDLEASATGDHIAVVYAVGEIDGSPSMGSTEEGINSDKLCETILKLKDDDNVKGMVFRVNSPGGSAFGSEQIWKAVMDFKAAGKPVAVSMGDYAASGGYYISCCADRIFAERTTITGSIGIFGMFPDASELMNDKLGLKVATVKTNEFADMGGYDRPFNEKESALLQGYINRGYDLFTKRCADGRGMSQDSIKVIGEGRVWTGVHAKKLGLVDQLGSLDDAIAVAKKKAKIEECQKKEKERNDRLNGKTTKKEESSKTEEKKDDNQKQKENSKVVKDEYNPPSSSGPVGANTAPQQKSNKELALEEYNRKIEQSGSRMVKKMEALRAAWMKANGKNYVDASNAAILEWGKANGAAEYSQYMEEKNTHDTLQKKYYEVYNS
jgi:signal peptide peptidase SppA